MLERQLLRRDCGGEGYQKGAGAPDRKEVAHGRFRLEWEVGYWEYAGERPGAVGRRRAADIPGRRGFVGRE